MSFFQLSMFSSIVCYSMPLKFDCLARFWVRQNRFQGRQTGAESLLLCQLINEINQHGRQNFNATR